MIYLIHFSRPFGHAQHYLGSTNLTIEERMSRHYSGRGSRLMQHVIAAGIECTVVRTWPGSRKQERLLKGKHNSRLLCPVCQQNGV